MDSGIRLKRRMREILMHFYQKVTQKNNFAIGSNF